MLRQYLEPEAVELFSGGNSQSEIAQLMPALQRELYRYLRPHEFQREAIAPDFTSPAGH